MKAGQKLILGLVGAGLLVGAVGYLTVRRYDAIETAYGKVIIRGKESFEEVHQVITDAKNTVLTGVGLVLLFITGFGFFVVKRAIVLEADLDKKMIERKKGEEILEQQTWGVRKTEEAIRALYKDLEKAKIRADRASKAKSDFLGNMSHEMRTPLNAVIGFAEVLRDGFYGPLNDRQKERIEDIAASGRHLLSLINDVLDLSKIEAGKMDLRLGEFDLEAVIKSVLSLVEERAVKNGIEISKDIKGDLGRIRADERMCKQILLNLLSNATKFTPKGGRVRLEAAKTEGNEVLISVWDTGIGIDGKDSNKVFDEFEQIDNSLTRKYSGTGLGMSLTKKFVELHGGNIWFESDGKDKGTRFSFTLPLGCIGEKGLS